MHLCLAAHKQPPHHPASRLAAGLQLPLTPSTKMSSLGLTAWMAAAMRCAASCQSVRWFPSPQDAGPCGSFFRSAAVQAEQSHKE